MAKELVGVNPHLDKCAERRGLLIAMALTSSVMGVEVIGGIVSNSLALLSDAWHMFSDLMALLLCYLASRISTRPATWNRTYGYHRVEILAAFVNGITLVAIAIFIFHEALARLFSAAEVRGLEMLIAALIGFIANLASMMVMSRGMLSLNVRAAFLHILSDALSSIGVIAGAIMIYLTGLYVVDSIIGMAIGLAVLYGTARMLRTAINILLEGAPEHINPKEVVERLRGIEGVLDVHDLHIWSITSHTHVLSAHLVLSERALGDPDRILNEVKAALKEGFGISHSTLQLEREGYREIGDVCRL
ncbi:MAG: cation diffusion facilitator family transporter [Candidatus Bathyarchaeia archaeon]